ncbi:hypothetical protein B0H11DRAFT_2250136 [Mycena galericulata]|nr:hypothetical protein B0H11DRAFT_2250136 [Mycena galericulata]
MAQRRGPKAKDLEQYCFEDDVAGKICCRVCHKASGADTRTWIARTSWKKHVQSPAHSKSLEQAAQTQKVEAETRQQYISVYSMPSTILQAPSSSDTSVPRAQFRPILDEDTNGISMTDFEDVMMREIDYSPEPDTFLADNAEILRRERELLLLDHLEEEFEGADDETVPNFIQDIYDNGKDYF